jgi:hypothetical protein
MRIIKLYNVFVQLDDPQDVNIGNMVHQLVMSEQTFTQ